MWQRADTWTSCVPGLTLSGPPAFGSTAEAPAVLPTSRSACPRAMGTWGACRPWQVHPGGQGPAADRGLPARACDTGGGDHTRRRWPAPVRTCAMNVASPRPSCWWPWQSRASAFRTLDPRKSYLVQEVRACGQHSSHQEDSHDRRASPVCWWWPCRSSALAHQAVSFRASPAPVLSRWQADGPL